MYTNIFINIYICISSEKKSLKKKFPFSKIKTLYTWRETGVGVPLVKCAPCRCVVVGDLCAYCMSYSLLWRHTVLLTVGVYSSNHRVLYTIGISMTRRFQKSVRSVRSAMLAYIHIHAHTCSCRW